MKTEEQALLEQKQRLLATEQNLHSKLIKEMDKKKTAISSLRTEIIERINRCDKLSQAHSENQYLKAALRRSVLFFEKGTIYLLLSKLITSDSLRKLVKWKITHLDYATRYEATPEETTA